MSVISDMIKSECTNDLTKSFLFVPILSEHNNNKEKFFQNLYGFACTCKCEWCDNIFLYIKKYYNKQKIIYTVL